ncbi:MAG: M20 family metallopeptidase [Clostridia bacterium]|nr:M20 family metallopeptidase [Clostridia bacterium]
MSVDAEYILNEAKAIESKIIADRREIHKHPEVGTCLPQTKGFVKNRLIEMGYQPKEICESGIVATVGKGGGKCVLLRADMDALKVNDKTELEFKSGDGKMHACGHDMHTSMLLGAAEILMKNKDKINGTVKLVFQPDEEGFTGAKAMLKAGVLDDPKPDIGFALHVNSGTPTGLLLCGRGVFMAGCTLFRITVSGKGCHGAMPETGVDPINIAAHIHLAIQEIVTREIGAKIPAVVTIGKFSAGEAPNIIPQTAVLEGTIRTFDRELSADILMRIGEIAENTAKSFRGSAVTEEMSSAPPLINNAELVNKTAEYAKELFGEKSVYVLDEGGMGSEDFASYTYELPCAYLLIGAGTSAENPLYGQR